MSKRFLTGCVACLALVVAACGTASSTPTNPAATASPSVTTPGATPTPSPAATSQASTPVTSPLPTDGSDLVAALAGASTSLQQPGTVRLDLTMTGTFDAGTKDYPWLVDLTGAQITADFDLAQGSGSINVSIPDMAGFTEEILVIDEVEYARSSLGGNIWTRQQANGSIGSIAQLLRDSTGSVLMDALADGTLNASMAPDATFHGTPAHQLTLAVTVPDAYDIEAFVASTLGSKVGSPPDPNELTGATKSLPVQLFLAADDMRPLGIELSMPSGASDPDLVGDGTVSIEGIFSRPLGTLSIKAPDHFVNATNPFDPPR